MRKQQQIWSKEHQTAQALPSEMGAKSYSKPSAMVVKFLRFLKSQDVNSGKVIDIGAGKGRNSLYMAKNGFEVFAIDYIQEAVDFIDQIAIEQDLGDNIKTYSHAVDEKWPFVDNFFDVAIDNFASIDIETMTGRDNYKQEMLRTLKPGGYAMVSVVSSDDEIEKEMIEKHPGVEKNSSIWPQNGKFQKNYDEEELRGFYQDFKIIELKKLQKKAHKLGRDFMATNYWLILRKD